MSLKIFVNHPPNTPLQTNQLVDGYVEAHYKKAEHRDLIQQIVLKFYGRSKVHIIRTQQSHNGQNSTTHTHHYRSKALLFAHYHRLNNPNWSPAASRRGEDGGILTFPFSFRIPTHAEPQDPPTTQAHRADVFSPREYFPGSVGYDPPGQVPPPMPLPDTVNEVSVRYDSHIRAEASVRYTLNAECPQLKAGASRLWMGNVDESVDLNIINPATVPPQDIQWIRLGFEDVIQSYELLPIDDRPKLGFRDRMSAVFRKDRLPWCAFSVTLQVQDTLWVDRPSDAALPIHVNIRRVASGAGERRKSDAGNELPSVPFPSDSKPVLPSQERLSAYLSQRPSLAGPQDSSIPTPQMNLTSLTIKLNHYMAVRGSETSISSYGSRTYELADSVTFFEWKASKKQPQVEIPVGDDVWFDLGHQMSITYGSMRSAASYSGFGGLQGEFRTPNLTRSFGIEWYMKFEGVEEEIKWESRAKYGGGLPLRFFRGDIASVAASTDTQALLPPPPSLPQSGSTLVDPRRSHPPSPHTQQTLPLKPLPGPPVPAKAQSQHGAPPPAYSPHADAGSSVSPQPAPAASWQGGDLSAADGLSGKMANLYMQDPVRGPGDTYEQSAGQSSTHGEAVDGGWGSNNPYSGQQSFGGGGEGCGAGTTYGHYDGAGEGGSWGASGGGGGHTSWEQGKH